MWLYNCSGLYKRDRKLYQIGGYGIAGGFSTAFAKVTVPIAFAIIAFGGILAAFLKINMFNPLGTAWNWKYMVLWLVLGIGIGYAMWAVQFSGYRLYQYLIAYFKPKKVYTNHFDMRKRNFSFTNVKIKATIKQSF